MPNNNLNNLLKDLKQKANPKKARLLARFFKTGSGQYGEGDIFLGITVPESRKIAVKYSKLPFHDISKLIKNKYHEARLIALLILVHQYKSSARTFLAKKQRKKIFNFYLKNTKYINNWDLVDLSAGYIVGNYLFDKDPEGMSTSYGTGRSILIKLAKSNSVWERRIAIISTFAFIYKGESRWTLKIVKLLINDPHDLIHKACGWMLREVGKRVSEKDLVIFLDKYSHKMPRTMLRYAIERLSENKRNYYLTNSKY
jgi:3-methyladenine DNA glycosylase AlkD